MRTVHSSFVYLYVGSIAYVYVGLLVYVYAGLCAYLYGKDSLRGYLHFVHVCMSVCVYVYDRH